MPKHFLYKDIFYLQINSKTISGSEMGWCVGTFPSLAFSEFSNGISLVLPLFLSVSFFLSGKTLERSLQGSRARILVFTFHGAGKLKTGETVTDPASEAGGRWALPLVLSPVPQQAYHSSPPIRQKQKSLVDSCFAVNNVTFARIVEMTLQK